MRGNEISVVICTKDRSDRLRLCLESLARSTVNPGEIVVVDQSTDDRTAEVVDRARENFACPVRRVALDSVGLAIARNVGIRASRGSVIAFTDDDCTVAPRWVEVIAREFMDSRVSCVCGHVCPADHTDRPRQARISTLNHCQRRVVVGKHNPFTIGRGNNMSFRKADLQKLGGFNEQIGLGTSVFAGEDLDILYRLMEVGGSIVHSPEALVYHAQPEEWKCVLTKKREYALSASAVLASRMRYGDLYAGLLAVGKLLYEFTYLFCGGLVRLNPEIAQVGWHSVLGTISGLKYALAPSFSDRITGLWAYARESYSCERVQDGSPTG